MARLFKRKGSSKWWADFKDPTHPSAGKDGRVRIPLGTDKDRAYTELGLLLGTSKSGLTGIPQKDTSYNAFKEKFLRQAATLNKVTLQGYKRAIGNLESGSHIPIQMVSQITPMLLSDLKTLWIERKRGLYVRNRDIQALKAMMRRAEAWNLVQKQNWSSVKADKEPQGRLLWYSPQDLKRLISQCNGVWKTLAMLGSRAGLRRSEIYWLSWEDVDFERKRVHISPKPDWNPKDHERRWIPMSSDLETHLRRLTKHSEWVLDEGEGRPTVGSMTIYFHRLSKKAGLKGNIHTLRHTYASHLASGGASPKAIKEVLGHSKLEMTNRYMHLAPDVQQGITAHLPPI